MAETFPDTGFESIQILLNHTIFSSKTRGGMVSEVRVADPYWYGEMSTVGLERAEIADWEAFLNMCVDRQLSIDFVHPLYPCPVSYNPDTFPGAAAGVIETLVDGKTIEVSGLSSSLVMKRGDRISLEQGDRVMYYMLEEDMAPLGMDLHHTMVLTPRLRTGLFTTGAAVRVSGAKMRLRISPNSVSFALQGGQPTAISFSVYEDGR